MTMQSSGLEQSPGVSVCGQPTRAIVAAERDLEWYFREAEAAYGFRAQGYEGGSGGVFDDEASWRMHERMRSHERFEAVKRWRRVADTLGRMAVGARVVARDIYSSRGWPDWTLALRTLFSVGTSGVTTLGVLPRSAAARRAYERAHASRAERGTSFVDPTRTWRVEHGVGGWPVWTWEQDRPASQRLAVRPTTTLLEWAAESIKPRVHKGRCVGGAPGWVRTAQSDCGSMRLETLRLYAEADHARRTAVLDADRASLS